MKTRTLRPRSECTAESPALTGSARRPTWYGEAATFLPALVALAFALEVATRGNVGHLELVRAVLTVAVTQVVPGAMVWRTVRPRQGWWVEDLVLGFAVGAALAVPVQIVAAWLSASWLAWALPLTGAGLLFAVPATRGRILGARCTALPLWWAVSFAGAFILPLRQVFGVAYGQPVRWSGWASPYVDMPYHLALAGEARHHFPPHYPQLSLESLSYHWFAHAWMAQVSSASGTSLEIILLRFMPALLAVALPMATAVAAVRLTRRIWAGPVAAALVFAVAELGVWGLTRVHLPVTPLSPTLGFGVVVMLALITLMVCRWRSETPAGTVVLVVLLLVVGGGSKGTVLPVLLLGCILAAGAALWWRTDGRWRVVGDAVLTAGVLALLVVVLFRGGAGGMSVDPFTAMVEARGPLLLGLDVAEISGLLAGSAVVGTLLMLHGSGLGALGALLDTESRHDPATWLLLGCGGAGVGALLVFTHPGSSQGYFHLNALPAIGILVAWGILALVEKQRRPALVAVAGAGVGVVAALLTRAWSDPPAGVAGVVEFWTPFAVFTGVVVLLSAVVTVVLAGPTGRPSLTVLTLVVVAFAASCLVPAARTVTQALPAAPHVTRSTIGAIHSSEIRAARWILRHSDPQDRVMTNRHCRDADADPCEHRTFFIAGYSQREVLLEGWTYNRFANAIAARTGEDFRMIPFWDPALLELNDGFIVRPDATAAEELYALGVRWVYVSDRAPHADDLAPFAERRLRTHLATVYELTPPSTDR